jgi:heme oxygenase
MSTDLAAALRAETRVAHERAETAPFVAILAAGELPLNDYTALVAQNYVIYQALESASRGWRGDPVAGPFVLEELMRVPSLERDLRQLLGSRWAPAAAALVLPATMRYVDRIREVGSTWAAGYIAHHYVRYLGDLAGGKIIRRGLEKAYGEAGKSASTFYEFDAVPKIKPFRDRYRGLLDEVPVGAAEQHQLITEAVDAFELNRMVFLELERMPGRRRAQGQPLERERR